MENKQPPFEFSEPWAKAQPVCELLPSKGKLLWIGCVPGHVGGQSRVAYFAIKELKLLGWEVVCIGMGSQILDPEETSPCRCFPLDIRDGKSVSSVIDSEKPDVVLFSHDIWKFYMLPMLREKYPNLPFCGWVTVDAHPIHQSWIPLIRNWNYLAVSTEFGKQTIYDRIPEKHIQVIPYGVDRELYQFPGNQQKLREEFCNLHKIPSLLGKTVFCFAGANQFKKNIGAIVDAFATLSQDREDVALILALKHSVSNFAGLEFKGDYEMSDLLAGTQNILLIGDFMDDASHAKLFQMSDFLVYPSQGEAPGLQISEAQLCGMIPICTDYAGSPEESLWPEFLIKDFVLFRGEMNCYRAMVGAEALYQKLLEAVTFNRECRDPSISEARKRYAAFLRGCFDKFIGRSWASTASQLDEMLSGALRGDLQVDPFITKI